MASISIRTWNIFMNRSPHAHMTHSLAFMNRSPRAHMTSLAFIFLNELMVLVGMTSCVICFHWPCVNEGKHVSFACCREVGWLLRC